MNVSNNFLSRLAEKHGETLNNSEQERSKRSQLNVQSVKHVITEPDSYSTVIARLGTSASGNECIELVFDGPIDKELSSSLRAQYFGYAIKEKVWKGTLNDENISFARQLATEDQIPWPCKAEDDRVSEIISDLQDGILGKYKHSLKLLAEIWDCDITDAMMRAVLETAEREQV